MEPLKIPKNPLYFCEKCQYKTNTKKDFTKHEMTLKHQNETKMEQNIPNVPNNPIVDILSNKYYCTICNIQMNSKTTFWRHKQTCNNHTNTNNDPSKKDDLIDYLIKENQEFKSLILELIKKDNNVINNNNTNTNTNCNNVNNAFNLNLFLNEKCKDAININDFVDNIKMQLSDLENFGQLGYTEGVSRILLKNLKDLDIYSRPIHCSDLKREVLYIKNNDQWTKEADDKPVFKNAIKQVANKNIKQIQTWKNENPGCTNSDSRKNDQYINIVMNSMSGGTSEEQQHNISQIVKNISKAVVIEKSIDS